MLQIKKMRADSVIDHAAEELKKYLRMMMPECGDIQIRFEPDARDGFRLGLLEDFHLPSEAQDPRLDDVIHVDTDETGGILAGSNPRSVLFAVYRFLRENGCRWLYPGIDGDYVPMKEIQPVSYHKMADHRFRGFCNEGSESQSCMIECADYYAKLELNVYMLEHLIPVSYYKRYYNHLHNEENRMPEPVPEWQYLQWKRWCEAEIAKRGLMFHDIGHGWTAEPFGLPSSDGKNRLKTMTIPPEVYENFALVQGERTVWHGNPNLTNLCMSNPKVRETVVQYVANYAENHQNVDYLHIWLADGQRNHCECEECVKMLPSDWYMVMMNELDEELTRRQLNTRIVFIAYIDTLWGPEKISLKNPERFSLLYAPISRSYLSGITEESVIPPAQPYVRNAWTSPKTAEENLALLNTWKKLYSGPVFCYEYHFWKPQFHEVGGVALAERLHLDVKALKRMGVDGIVQDGSQRSGFPNAFPVYVYAETLMNRNCDFESLKEDYYSHVYGEDWQLAVSLLERMSRAFGFAFLNGKESKNPNISAYFNPERAKRLEAVAELASEARTLAQKHRTCNTRPETVSWRMLEFWADWCAELEKPARAMALGHNFEGEQLLREFLKTVGKRELEFDRYYDHGLAGYTFQRAWGKPAASRAPEVLYL